MRPIVRIENLSKLYHIGARLASYKTIRETLTDAVKNPFKWFSRNDQPEENTIWALKSINFEVRPGEVVGIIGHNGAGKSTLLKILSQITEPTNGNIELYGRVSSLLEVGTGFHHELTGRENIFLNGAILGMKQKEIERKFDDIVSFAETGKFIDTPVKHYSSGMQMRLAFAVAANLEPDVLVVDEVLAVGDANFQKKCLGKMSDITKQGRTVLFVSHNMGAVRGLCQRAIWLKQGIMIADGPSEKIVSDYLASIEEGFIQSAVNDTGLQITKIVFRNGKGESAINFKYGESLKVDIHYNATQKLNKPYFWVAVSGQQGALFGANMLLDGFRPDFIQGEGVISCVFKELSLLPQLYTVSMAVRAEDGGRALFKPTDVGFFQIIGSASEIGYKSDIADTLAWVSTPVVVPYEWHLPNNSIYSMDPVKISAN